VSGLVGRTVSSKTFPCRITGRTGEVACAWLARISAIFFEVRLPGKKGSINQQIRETAPGNWVTSATFTRETPITPPVALGMDPSRLLFPPEIPPKTTGKLHSTWTPLPATSVISIRLLRHECAIAQPGRGSRGPDGNLPRSSASSTSRLVECRASFSSSPRHPCASLPFPPAGLPVLWPCIGRDSRFTSYQMRRSVRN